MEHGGIYCSGVEQEFTGDLLTGFGLFASHGIGGVDRISELYFGTIVRCAPLRWCMEGLARVVVLKLVECSCDVS